MFLTTTTASLFASNLRLAGSRNAFRTISAASGVDIRSSLGADRLFEGLNVESAMEALAKADAVCFDVDSTVIQEEGIVRQILFIYRRFLCFYVNVFISTSTNILNYCQGCLS